MIDNVMNVSFSERHSSLLSERLFDFLGVFINRTAFGQFEVGVMSG